MSSLEFAGQPHSNKSRPSNKKIGRFLSDFIPLKHRHFHGSPLGIGGVKDLTSLEKYRETGKRRLDKLAP